jgi:acetyltransferase-like isoleucine patch superfamily enzyme
MKIKINYFFYLLRFIYFVVFKRNIDWNSNLVGFGKNVILKSFNKSKIKFGKNNFFDDGCCLVALDGGEITFGDDVKVNRNVTIVARKKIKICNNVIFGPNSLVYDHDYNVNLLDKKKEYISKEILINKNCWIGGLVFIGKGVEIGEGSAIAAGSKVVKNVEKKIVFKNRI